MICRFLQQGEALEVTPFDGEVEFLLLCRESLSGTGRA